MSENSKPPLGLEPKDIFWERCVKVRISQIERAIERYRNAKVGVPDKWIAELQDLKSKEVKCHGPHV
jgi:hypothetical protein